MPPPPPPTQKPAPDVPVGSGCPECGSLNYASVGKVPSGPHAGERLPPRCFDCGYGLSQLNTTQGLEPPGGDTKAAMQVKSAGYQPGIIVGHVK